MEPIFVKKEFEEVVNDYKGDISMKNDKPSTSAEENSSTSGLAIKQEWIVCDNSMDYNKSVVKEEPEDEEDDFYEDKQAELKFQVKNEALLDNWMDSEVQYKDIPEKIFLPEAEKEIGNNPESIIDKIEDNFNFVYECKQCSIQFFNKELFANHKDKCLKPKGKVDKEKLIKCDHCPKKYKTRGGLSLHKKYVHFKDEQEQLKCGQCEYQTMRKGDLRIHLRIHDRKSQLKCHFCQYKAVQIVHLNAHILRKHKKQNKIKITSKIHQCTKCSYSTVYKSSYDNHIKVCLKLKNVKWYECHVCHYRSIQESNLKSHIKTHNKIN